MKVDITGGKELEAAFSQLVNGATKRRTALRALQKAAEIVRDKARELAPDDPATGAGTYLRESIRVGKPKGEPQKSGNQGTLVTTFVGIDGSVLPPKPSSKRTTKKGSAKEGGGVATYSILVENGTATHPAKPYMRPAFEQTQNEAIQSIMEIATKEIERTAARAARKAAKKVG